jgi:two-component system response regulator AtoC
MKERNSVLIVDDEEIIRDSLAQWLESCGYEVLTAANGREGIEILKKHPVRVVLSDLVMPVMDGIAFVKEARGLFPDISVVIITAHATIETAITAMREGACDYVEKPFCPEAIEILVSNLQAHQQLISENERLRTALKKKDRLEDLVFKSEPMHKVAEMVRAVAPSNATVLVVGESGTGKELVARALHNLSPRKDKPFVAVACSALPDTLLESELFGHEKGAFTGASSRRMGRFELADSGTIFLDEIGDISPKTQQSLLRVIETREFTRVGGGETLKSDVRVISATNRDLPTLVNNDIFRKDLFYRLNVVTIELPPLRQREEDIPLLARHFLAKFTAEQNKPEVEDFDAEAMKKLLKHDYPGNVRELANMVERAVLLSTGSNVTAEDLTVPEISQAAQTPYLHSGKTIREVEKAHILRTLGETKGNRSEAARILGIERATLYNKLKSYDEV